LEKQRGKEKKIEILNRTRYRKSKMQAATNRDAE
jgi:hypothetical protein